MPLVSVIIPAYNSGPYLNVAVQSVIAQTFTDWECIVVDVGSTEDLSRVEKMDPRVRLVRQENRGISMARNRGIAESAGEFIAFLDHDDAFLPAKLERQVAAMACDVNIGLCHTDFAVMDESGNYAPGGCGTNTATDFLTMLQFGAPYPTTTMVRRSVFSLVGVFDPFLTPSEDQDLFVRIAKFFRVAYLPSCEALYRVHGTNTSKNYMVCYRTMENLAKRHQIFSAYRGDRDALRAAKRMMPHRRKKVFGPQAFDAARAGFRGGSARNFTLHLARAIWWSPRYTLASLAKFPFRRRKSPVGPVAGSAKSRLREESGSAGTAESGEGA